MQNKKTADNMLTLRSKITVRYTTHPADMGYDGKKSNWLNMAGKTMGLRNAATAEHDIRKKIGTGVDCRFDYQHNSKPISIVSIRDLVNMADAIEATR